MLNKPISASESVSLSPPEVVLSSTCFDERNLEPLCDHLGAHGIKNLELSGNLRPLALDAIRQLLADRSPEIRFFVHNYFPAPEEPFVLNLGHPDTRDRSIEHCKQAIDLCKDFGVTQYSVHGGFAINPRPKDLGQGQKHLVALDFDESRAVFVAAVEEVADHAERNGVELLLENNVAAGFNCPDGINHRYHLTDMEESALLLPLFDHPAIGMMLDTGHLNVSATTLGFEAVDFIERFRSHIGAVQISNNDGLSDQNDPVSEDSWFWPHVPWDRVDYVSLEVTGQMPETMLAQIDLTHRKIAEALNARS